MRNYFTLGGVDSRDYGVYISGQGTFESPVRELNMLDVPGRDGSLISDVTRLQNGTLTYPAYIYRNFRENIGKLRAFLLSSAGYRRLVDTYHPDEYRLAAYRGALAPEVTQRNDAGQFDITFDVMPQRYLISGETAISYSISGGSYQILNNPTLFTARPLIRIYGVTSVGINGVYVSTLENSGEYIDVDCEAMEAYYGASNRNSYITLTSNTFPSLIPGRNSIHLRADATRIEITPRWWTV